MNTYIYMFGCMLTRFGRFRRVLVAFWSFSIVHSVGRSTLSLGCQQLAVLGRHRRSRLRSVGRAVALVVNNLSIPPTFRFRYQVAQRNEQGSQ